MTDRTIFFTQTMARVHAKQGNLDQAAEIYRYLIKQEPERDDLVSELADIEKQLLETAPDHLGTLFEKWFELIFSHNRIQKLRQLEKGYTSASDHDDTAP